MFRQTTPEFYELTSNSGKNPSVTPGSSAQTATFMLNNLPTGQNGRLWNYVSAIVLKVVTTFDQPAMGGVAVNADKLWKVLQSIQVQCPILGTLMSHANNRGAVVGNLDQYFGMNYNALPVRAQIAAADGDTTVTLYYRIPFALGFLASPMETAPWTGFLEGGTVEVKLDVSTVFNGDSTGAVIKAPTNFRCWLEMVPSPEPLLHVPFNFREHITPGGSTRHVIQDMGAPDGIQGVDLSKGAGLMCLLMLTDATGIGLGGSDGADNVLSYDLEWRNQVRIDTPDAPFVAFQAMMGVNRRQKPAAPVTSDGAGFPYTIAASPNGDANDAQALIFPLVAPGNEQYTSKLQTVFGAKAINFTYTVTPSASSVFRGGYAYAWDEQFATALAMRIAPQSAGKLVAKTLNKQTGAIWGKKKLAYTQAKVK